MKQIISLLVAFIMIISLPLHANATTANMVEYIKLTSSNERLSNDGKFDFKVYSIVPSDHHFKTTSNQISLSASAQIYSEDPSVSPRNADNIFFIFYLYKVGYTDPVGQFKQAANGKTGYVTFSVSTNAEYYFKIEASGSLGPWESIQGNGDLSNIYIV